MNWVWITYEFCMYFYIVQWQFVAVAIHINFWLNSSEILGVCSFLPLSPPGWRGIVVTVRAGGRAGGRTGGRAGGRSGGRLPDLRNPYLCNRLMDFLCSKFYGIV